MDLRFYDFELNFLKQLRTSRTRWGPKYNDIGSFALNIPITEPFLKNIIDSIKAKRYMLVTQGRLSGIIIGYDIENEGKIYGRSMSWILAKRTVEKFEEVTGNPVTLVKGWFETAFNDCPTFLFGSAPEVTEEITISKTSDVILSSLITEALKMQNLGFEVIPDVQNKTWLFNILQGTARDFVPSVANKKAYDTRITYDVLDVANCGYYTVDDQRQYIDTEATGLYRWETTLSGTTEQEAREDLKTKAPKDDTTFNLLDYRYGVDYELGDLLTLQIQKGAYKAVTQKRVTEIEVTYDQSGKTEKPKLE